MSARNSKSGKVFPRNESFDSFSVRCCPALAWVDRSGRGFNPRPAPGPARPAQNRFKTGLGRLRSAREEGGGSRGGRGFFFGKKLSIAGGIVYNSAFPQNSTHSSPSDSDNETHLPALQHSPQARTRFSRANGDAARTRHPQRPPPQRTRPTLRLTLPPTPSPPTPSVSHSSHPHTPSPSSPSVLPVFHPLHSPTCLNLESETLHARAARRFSTRRPPRTKNRGAARQSILPPEKTRNPAPRTHRGEKTHPPRLRPQPRPPHPPRALSPKTPPRTPPHGRRRRHRRPPRQK